MATIRLDMTMSLDGYVAGPDDGPDEPMGVGGFRLFNWLDKRDDPGPSGEVYAELLTTRALIFGRRTYEHAGHWGGDHHHGVPILVLTHDVPDEPPPGTVRFVTDVAECAALARDTVGDGVAMVAGAGAAQSLLGAGELDELELHSCRCCSAAAGGCSTTSRPSTSSSTSCGRCGPPTPRTRAGTSCTCATASGRAGVRERMTDRPPSPAQPLTRWARPRSGHVRKDRSALIRSGIDGTCKAGCDRQRADDHTLAVLGVKDWPQRLGPVLRVWCSSRRSDRGRTSMQTAARYLSTLAALAAAAGRERLVGVGR